MPNRSDGVHCDAPLTVLPGIGPTRARQLAQLDVVTVLDLLAHLPSRWEDRSCQMPLGEIQEPGGPWRVSGRLDRLRQSGRRGRRCVSVVAGRLADREHTLQVVWFNQPWIANQLERGQTVTLFGRVRCSDRDELQLVNPELVNDQDGDDGTAWLPRYSRLGPLTEGRLRTLIRLAARSLSAGDEPVPVELCARLRVPCRTGALSAVHLPSADDELIADRFAAATETARRRLAFEELLSTSAAGVIDRYRRSACAAPVCRVDEQLRAITREVLPFRLTSAQRRVTRAIVEDLARPQPMARLLHGDVGSGKTVVAALAALVALANGHQVAVMAPTELLAEQHYQALQRLLTAAGYRPSLLTGSVPQGDRREILTALAGGTQQLVVGTHALVQEQVRFRRLGLAIVDEQHRFGVSHRQALVDKSTTPHLLVMSATPIPRSLALTAYGGLDVSRLDELPPGRQPVRTVLRSQRSRPRLEAFLRKEISAGGRVYVVFPLIETAEQGTVVALEDRREELAAALRPATVGVVHGKLRRQEQEEVTQAFREGRLQVLLATTVIEVGVDVPEATVMVIESAERFGLSQLHQLRGRVGRGQRPSWCVLLTGPEVTAAARQRLAVLCRTHDGFEIADEDLRLRGPGELAGLRQSGLGALRFADLVRDRELVEAASRAAHRLAATGDLASVLPRLHGARAAMKPFPVG